MLIWLAPPSLSKGGGDLRDVRQLSVLPFRRAYLPIRFSYQLAMMMCLPVRLADGRGAFRTFRVIVPYI